MNKLFFTVLLNIFTCFFVLHSECSETLHSNKKPHVIVITCHDIGQHLGCYGVDEVRTPNIDRLAAQGVIFRNAFSTSAVCTPGRGSLHTGRYPQSNGLMGLTHAPWWWRLNENEKHTAQILEEHDYESYLVGFNHIDPDPKRLGYTFVPEIIEKGEEGITKTAIDVINGLSERSKPAFVKIGYHLVHRVFTHGVDSTNGIFVPPYLANTKIMRKDLAEFQAQIHYLDQQIGQIMEALKESNIAEETLLVFTSDHGIPYPGSKWTIRRAGIQVPFIFYMPQTIFSGGKQYNEIFSNIDFIPTLLSYLNFEIPENIQGLDFIPFLSNKEVKGPRKYAFGQYTTDMKRDNLSRCIIGEKYHLIRYFDQGRTVELPIDVNPQRFAHHVERAKSVAPRPFAQLYNIINDPFELDDLGKGEAFQTVKKELSDELLNWMKEVDDPLLQGPLQTPYYEKAIKDFTKE
jgi:N-sulfoglucosamine sulfohydrolase